jgi:putative transposase
MAESFFGTLQLELLDRRHWETRAELASAIFEEVVSFFVEFEAAVPRLTPAFW